MQSVLYWIGYVVQKFGLRKSKKKLEYHDWLSM